MKIRQERRAKTDRENVRERVTRLSCEDERMLLIHELSADAIIIGDKSPRTNWSGSDRRTHWYYEISRHVIQNILKKNSSEHESLRVQVKCG